MASLGDEYGTPDDLFQAIASEFGPFDMDGAAQEDNTKLPKWTNDASLDTWEGRIWLNPPFSKMPYFCKLSYQHTFIGGSVVMICRNDPSTQWWQKWIHRQPVYMLRRRVPFVGATQVYNFPVAIALFENVLFQYKTYEYFEGWGTKKRKAA